MHVLRNFRVYLGPALAVVTASTHHTPTAACGGVDCLYNIIYMYIYIYTYNNNNNNDRLTAFDPGQPG